MRTRKDIEKQESRELAPYAARSSESRGRQHAEDEHPLRTAFQRDRDRIIHSTAFRRLEYKTQVFVNHEGDHYRTRLTHTLEVAQLARTIARTLGLNEDLSETIALAHDIGHTPFGHSGEDALTEIIIELKKRGDKDIKIDRFEHNRQGLRVVTMLERRYPAFPGLNLTYEVREAIIKHSTKYDAPEIDDNVKIYELHRHPSLEGQVVDLADAIAYNNHDLDDGLNSGILSRESLSNIGIWNDAERHVARKYCNLSTDYQNKMAIRYLINLLVTDTIEETGRRIKSSGVNSLEDVRDASGSLVGLSSEMEEKVAELGDFLKHDFYRHYRVARMASKAHRFIGQIFMEYYENEGNLPLEYQAWAVKEGKARAICDYIAGMTDRYAQDEYIKLFQPYERV